MAFTYTRETTLVTPGGRVVGGTYTNTASSTGGDIDTGMTRTSSMTLQPKTTAVVTSFPVVNETLPRMGAVTIVTTADEVGYWIAVGY